MKQFQPHHQRVVTEKAELDEKRDKLSAFACTPAFLSLETAEQERLGRQSSIMASYSEVLGERIAAFTAEVPHA